MLLSSTDLDGVLGAMQAALAAIKRSMCALPAVRSALLTGLASTYATLPDDNSEVRKMCL